MDGVIEIIDLPDPEHKKSMFPYIEPTLETANKIDTNQKLIDDYFIDLQIKFGKVNDVAAEQKKQKKLEDTIESAIDNTNPFSTFDDFWWEDDMFNKRDSTAIIDASKNILEEMKKIFGKILTKIQPVDNRTEEELIDNQFILIDDRAQQELEYDDYISLKSENEEDFSLESGSENEVEDIDLTSAWDPKQTTITNPGPKIKLSTDYK